MRAGFMLPTITYTRLFHSMDATWAAKPSSQLVCANSAASASLAGEWK